MKKLIYDLKGKFNTNYFRANSSGLCNGVNLVVEFGQFQWCFINFYIENDLLELQQMSFDRKLKYTHLYLCQKNKNKI